MSASLFESKTFGLGQIITQRKLISVPFYQRSFCWGADNINEFVEDISLAFENNDPEYFVGLIVIQHPDDYSSGWIVLDGQQRLTTTTMLFSAIRNWLVENNFEDDASQLENEFLSTRKLGSSYSSRIILNKENSVVYEENVIKRKNLKSLKEERKNYKRGSSNRLLIEAAILCRESINSLIGKLDSSERKAGRLFALSAYLESKVKAVCVEVSRDTDAYTLFESMNNRGAALSALDLVKNFTYSNTRDANHDLQDKWREIELLIQDEKQDDFLKTFWTARYGVVQKHALFEKIKNQYEEAGSALSLIDQLRVDAEIISAMDDYRDSFWDQWPEEVRLGVKTIKVLESKQLRPIMISAILKWDREDVAQLIKELITVVVRFQIIGQGRTGIVERVFGRLCQAIFSGNLTNASEARSALSELMVEDSHFINAFASHTESKPGRLIYLLERISVGTTDVYSRSLENVRLVKYIENESVNYIGNYFLEDFHLADESTEKSHVLGIGNSSQIIKPISLEDVLSRGKMLGEIACTIWR